MHLPVESVVASRPPVVGVLCENATPLASNRASAMVANNSSVRLISTLPSFRGGRRVGLPFRPELYNATTLARGDESPMNFAPFIALFLANFRECPKGEVRRIP